MLPWTGQGMTAASFHHGQPATGPPVVGQPVLLALELARDAAVPNVRPPVLKVEEAESLLDAAWEAPSFGSGFKLILEYGVAKAPTGDRKVAKGCSKLPKFEGGAADRGRARPALTKSQCDALCEGLQLGYRWVPWRPLVPWWDVEYQSEDPGQLVLLAPRAKTNSGPSPARSLPSGVLEEAPSGRNCIAVQSRGQRARVRGTLAARSAASTARSEAELTRGGAFRDWLGNTEKTTDDAGGFYDRSLGAVTNDGAANKPYQLKSATLSGARGGTVRAKYDDAGHMVRMDLARSGPCLPTGATCSQRFAYDWDEVGRLGRARRWDTAPGSSIDDPLPGGTPDADLRYQYDAGDQRVIKHAVDTSGESFTLYVFESLELRRSQFGSAYSDTGSGPDDYEASVFTVVPYLLANGVRLARLAYEGTSEVPEVTPGTGAGQVNASVSQVHIFFELGDHLGSTSVVLDKATSELVERSTFQGYGATESDYRPGRWNAFREDYKFTGKEEDAEVGLTYFGKRYLNAYLGRWISADPLAIHAPGEADLNVYAYVSGSILKNVDPLGLQSTDPVSSGGASSTEAPDPADHMGTAHEGASSDGSYLEATSDPEWQKGVGGAATGLALVGCAIASAGACVAGLAQFELSRQAIADTPARPGSQEAHDREIASDSNGAMLVAGGALKVAAPVAVAAGRAAASGVRSTVAQWLREMAKKLGWSRPVHVDVGGEGAYRGAINVNPGTTTTTTGEPGLQIPNRVAGTAQEIPLPSRSADLVTVENAPIHGSAPAELARIVRPGGTVRLTHPLSYAEKHHGRVRELVGGKAVVRVSEANGVEMMTTEIQVPK